MPDVSHQLTWLFVLAAPAACIAWTVTHEELFDEPENTASQLLPETTRPASGRYSPGR